MNVLEAFALFVVMIVTFWFFGLIGLAVLGLIICLCYFGSKPEKSKREKVTLKNREKEKPCHPHGLTNCPFCNPKPKTNDKVYLDSKIPSVYNDEEEVDSKIEEAAM